jgi:hypothetical protein
MHVRHFEILCIVYHREVDGVMANLLSAWGGAKRGEETMKISLKLCRHSVLRSSQPIPPAPTSSACMSLNDMACRDGDGEGDVGGVGV